MKLIDDEIAKYERQAREAHADADQTRDGFRRDFARQCEAKARQWRELRDAIDPKSDGENTKRYDCTMNYEILNPYMEEAECGDYVTWEDYETLRRELKIAKSDIKAEQHVQVYLRQHKIDYMEAAEETQRALHHELAQVISERDALLNGGTDK